MRAWLRNVLLLTLCSGLAPPLTAAPPSVQDLPYGEVLFHFYQEDYFNSIVRLQIARQQERLPHHADAAELLLGGLDLSYGLRDAADDIFQRLLTADTTRAAVRNRAWYYLAKISWQRGDTARAIRALAQIQGELSAATRGAAAAWTQRGGRQRIAGGAHRCHVDAVPGLQPWGRAAAQQPAGRGDATAGAHR
jgi:hypothetical protein